MLLLIAVIVLTIFAWRNGWNWYSLIPGCVGIALCLGTFASIDLYNNGSISGGNLIWLSIVDVIDIVILIILVVKKPSKLIQELNLKNNNLKND